MQPRHLILDWSGTLVNDLPPVFEAVNHVLTTFGRAPFTLPEFRRNFCLPVAKFYALHLADVPSARLNEVFFASYRQLQDTITILPHTLDFLEFCRREEIGLYIATTVDEVSYQQQARQFGVEGYITKAYAGLDDKTRQIHRILNENSLSRPETMFVGDMEHDMEAGQAGGIRTCAVLTGYTPLEKLSAAGPDWICAHLGELQHRLSLQESIHG